MFDANTIDGTGVFAAMGGFMVFAIVISLWSLAWKGWALYLAARRGEKPWYILMLILNTAGILEIIYIFAIAKRSDMTAPKAPTSIPPTTV